jgi:cadmium resistance protein CadD (predicted permease)
MEFSQVLAMDMNEYWKSRVSQEEKQRYDHCIGFHLENINGADCMGIYISIFVALTCVTLRISKLEIFDEIEEWEIMLQHYCYAVGAKGMVATEMSGFFRNLEQESILKC